MSKLDRLGWAVRGTYRIGEVLFGARSTSGPFGRWLDDMLGDYRSDEQAPTRYSIVVADEDDHGLRAKERYHTLYNGSTALIKTSSLETMVRALFADLETMRFEDRDDAMYGDVIPITKDGVTAVVPAVMGPFLMTLGSRRMARAGLTVPFESSSGIDPDTGEIIPVRPLVDLPVDWRDRLASSVPIDGREGQAPITDARRADIVVSVGWGDEPIAPVSRALALYRLGSHVANFPPFGERGLHALRKTVEGARCFEMAAQRPAEMLDALLVALTRD